MEHLGPVILLLLLGAAAAATIDPAAYLAYQAIPPKKSVQEIWAAHEHLPNWADIKQAADDTWDELPKSYLPDYKNPCWQSNGKFKCLPYMQILGVSKCGTTDLYHRLTFHKDFIESSWKGPHFWDESAYRSSMKTPSNHLRAKYDGSFPAYVSVFDKAALQIKENKFGVTGEASSNTFTGVVSYLRGMTLTKKTNATLAEYMWEAAPWSKFIVLMRDPVARYYSAYHYYRSRALGPGTPEEFHARAAAEIDQMKTCFREAGEHMCLKIYRPQQLIKGLYALYIPYWLKLWPRDQFFFVRTEDYKAAAAEHVQAAADFLGLRKLDDPSWIKGAEKMEKRNEKSYPMMKPETEKMLQDFYRPYNQRLMKLLNNDPRWLWGY